MSRQEEIESMTAAAALAAFWLEAAGDAVRNECIDAKHYPAGIAGFVIASAIHHHGERQVYAASMIAEGLQAVASAILESKWKQS